MHDLALQVIKRFILHSKKTAFVVEHDFIMATYLADRVIVYEGTPSVKALANSPQTLLSGSATATEQFTRVLTCRRHEQVPVHAGRHVPP